MRLWPFIPQREFREVLEWNTDILQSKNSEQRLALRTLPRQRLGFQHLLDPRQFSTAKALVAEAGHEVMHVPLWMYIRRLGSIASGLSSLPADTDNEEYVAGGKAVVWEDEWTYEIVDVTAASGGVLTLGAPTTGTYSDAYLCPLREFRMAQAMDASRGASDIQRTQVYFQSTDTVALGNPAASATYLGHDVLEERPTILGDMNDRLVRDVKVVDSSLGLIDVQPTLNYLDSTSQMGWDTLSRVELAELRRWLYSRRGKQVGFWMPTWNNDLTLLSDIAAGSLTINVRSIGYSSAFGVRDIEIRPFSGTVRRLRITGGSPGAEPGTETLLLGEAAGFILAANDVESVSFLDFSRLDADRIEIRHRSAQGASILVPIAKVPAP